MKRLGKQFKDQDYFKKLSPEERAWLSKFNREYYDGDFSKSGGGDALHKTKEQKRDCYNRNNAMNRDVSNREELKTPLDSLAGKTKKQVF